MSKKSNRKHLNLGNEVIFQGFDSLYKQVLNIEDWLLCPEVQVDAEETSMTLRIHLNHFQSKIRVVDLKAKRKKLQNSRQMTFTTCSTNKS